MTANLRTRLLDKIAPMQDPDVSRLDSWDHPALLLDENLNTGAMPVIASRRPVAAKPSMADPVPYRADQFGKLPSVLPTHRAMHPAFAFAHAAALVGVAGGFVYLIGAL